MNANARIVAAFNEANPVGTIVRYWRGVYEGEPSGTGPTRNAAFLNNNDVPAVFIEGCSGYMALTHVEVAS
jgi:hypothetical protein